MFNQLSLGQKVGGQLHTTPETCAHDGRSDTAIQASYTFCRIYLPQAVPRVAIVMLCADRQEGRVRLQPGFDEEEGRSYDGTYCARECAGKEIDRYRLDVWVRIEKRCECGAEGLVEAQTASIETKLVDVLDESSVRSVLLKDSSGHTAQFRPRKRPPKPSFRRTVATPCATPLYKRGAFCLLCSSPCNCKRILMVSKLWETVTAPHPAMPPATKPPAVVAILRLQAAANAVALLGANLALEGCE